MAAVDPETPHKGGRVPSALATALVALVFAVAPSSPAAAQVRSDSLAPPGRLVDLGGYRLHLLCTGRADPGGPTVVLSIGGGGFASDWSLVRTPLSDSARVCSYDRPGFGWSDAGPTPRTFAQEAFELRSALEKAGERAPFILGDRSVHLFRCYVPQDDYLAEELAAFYDAWARTSHPLGDMPLVVITGTKPRVPPPGLTEAQLRADSLRLDLTKLSSRGSEVHDPLSGHHVQRDNPDFIVDVVRRMMLRGRE